MNCDATISYFRQELTRGLKDAFFLVLNSKHILNCPFRD